MNRITLLQNLINRLKARRYLEIGVFQGGTFLSISAPVKYAVDPKFQISAQDKTRHKFKWKFWRRVTYFEMPSDTFFAKHARRLGPIDVIFIDGLHTYSQSLADVLNSLEYLSKRGVIVMHDCYPPHAAAAHPADSLEHAISLNLSGWTGEWCGDTWKTICKLRSSRDDLQIFVLNCDYGLGVITRGKPEQMLDFNDAMIEQMSYEQMREDPERILNLKPAGYAEQFLNSL